MVLSRVSGEGHDAADGYYELAEAELALIDKAAEISDTVIVLVNSPSALAIHALKSRHLQRPLPLPSLPKRKP